MDSKQLQEIRENIESYLAFECGIHGGTGTGLTMCYSHEKGHKDFKEWLTDGGLNLLLDHIDKLTKAAEKAETLLRAECEDCQKYVAVTCISDVACDVLKVANELQELLKEAADHETR